MGEDHRLLRVDAAGKVVDDDVVDVVGDVCRGITVGNDLVVGDDDVRAYAAVLQVDTPLECSEVVPEMQPARGPVTREHAVLSGIDLEIRANQVALAFCRLETALVWHVSAAFLSKTSARWYTIWKNVRLVIAQILGMDTVGFEFGEAGTNPEDETVDIAHDEVIDLIGSHVEPIAHEAADDAAMHDDGRAAFEAL